MSRKSENTGFVCARCGKAVVALSNGSYRNHCPHCLYSLHVDNAPGDRQSACHGCMRPVDVRWNSKKGYQIIHRCEKCGAEKANRVAVDCEMADDPDVVWRLLNRSFRPMGRKG